MAAQLVTAKMTPGALRLVRLIAAATGEKQYEVLIRLLAVEAGRLGLDSSPPCRLAKGGFS
jgi:hypothetical protein